MRRILLTTVAAFLSFEAAAFDGAMVRLGADQSIATSTEHKSINQVIEWGAAEYDTKGFWSSSQPTRLTVPAGVQWVRLTVSQIYASEGYADGRFICTGFRQFIILKNKTPVNYGWFPGNPAGNRIPVCGTTSDFSGFTPVIPVSEGDYFEATAYQNTGAPLNLRKSGGTWFSIEVLQ